MQNPSNKNNNPLLKIGEAAKILGVSIDTLRRWEKAGKIKAVRTPGGTRLYSISTLKKVNPASVEDYHAKSQTTEELLKRDSEPVVLRVAKDLPRMWDSNDKVKSSFANKFILGTAFFAFLVILFTGIVATFSFLKPEATQNLLKNNIASGIFEKLGFIPPDEAPPPLVVQKLNKNSNVLAVTSTSPFLEVNADTQILGSLFVRDSINNLILEATPSANSFVLGSGNTTLTVTNDALLDQDVSTAAAPTFNTLKLSGTKDQLILGSTGTLTWTPTSAKIITLPDATGTVLLDSATQTLTNKTISGSSNTFSSIPNSALSNASITINTGSGLSGGGSVSLGGSISLSSSVTNTITSVSNTDGTLTISPTTGAVVASLNLANANTWTANQIFSGNVGIGGSLTVTGLGVFNGGVSTNNLCLNGICQTSLSAGESTTASNGLTLSGFDVQLGGQLTQTTSININSQNFGFLGGNVGIGTTNPLYQLQTTGNVGIGGSLTVGTVNASSLTTPAFQLTTGAGNNYILTSDASGNGSWASSLPGGFIADNSLDFAQFKDLMTLDASTDIALGAYNLTTSGAGAVAFNNSGTFTVAGAATFNSTINTNTFTSTALTFSGSGNIGIGASIPGTNLNLNPGSGGLVNIAGGSGSTGCTIDDTTGSLTCTGSIGVGSSSGQSGLWSRIGTTLSPAFTGDDVTTSGNISATGTGTVTSGGTLTAQNGLTLSTGALNLTSTSGIANLNLTLDTKAFNINGTTFNVDTFNSRVGIGTSSPNYALDVVGQVNGSTGLCIAGDCKSSWTGVGGYTASNGITLSSQDFQLGGSLTRATGIDINNQNFGFLGGNVGIGTTNPAGRLDLTDTSNTAASFSLTNSTATTIGNGGSTLGVLNIALNGLSSGNGLNLSSTSSAFSSGYLANLDWSPTTSTTATGSLLNIGIGVSGMGANFLNLNDAGSSVFSISQTALTTSLPVNFTSPGDVSVAYDINMTNPTASYIKSSAPLYITAGKVFNSSDLVLTTYNQGSIVLAKDFTSTAAVTNYLSQIAGNDTTAIANTNYGLYSVISHTGNAAKTGVGLYSTLSTSSTTADTLIGADLSTTTTGIITTGTRNIYGLRSQPNSTAASTGGTTNVYGIYTKADGTVGAGGTINAYGLYIANGTMTTTGTTKNIGLYVEAPTGASTNYAAIFAGGNVGIGTTSMGAALQVNGGGLFGWGTASVAGPANGLAVFGNVGIGTTSPAYKLDVIGQVNGSTGLCIAGDCKSSWTGVGGYTASNGITLSSQDFQLGGSLTRATGIDINSQNFGFLGGNVGIGMTNPVYLFDVNAVVTSPGATAVGGSIAINGAGITSSNDAQGLLASATTTSGSAAFGSGKRLIGVNSSVGNNASNVSTAIGFMTTPYTWVSGTITNLHGYMAQDFQTFTGGSVTSQAGFTSANLDNATNNTNLLLGTTTIPAGNFSIYNSSTYSNYFNGNVGIGTSSPSQLFQVNYSSANPIVMTSGGNVGIGTTGPAAPLDVAANLTSGTIINMAYPNITTLSGDLIGWSLDLNSGKVLPNNNSITGEQITLATTTTTSGSSNLKGLVVNFGTGAGINNNSAGTLTYTAADLSMPALTQTQGTLNANGVLVTTPATITTGGTANGINIAATGVGAGALNGINISAITPLAGTEIALNVGAGWDTILKVGSTTVINGSGVTQVAGGGTGIATYNTGDILYASGATTLTNLGIGTSGQVLTTTNGVPVWGNINGSSCTTCLINNPSSTAVNTISPTGQATTGLSVRQTSTASPTQDIFNVTSSDGNTKYFYVDKDGNVSTGGMASQTLTLTPASDTTALTLVGTNVLTQNLAYINAHNTQGTILNMAYGSSQALTGSLTGQAIDFTNLGIGATNQNVTGAAITLPAVTNTNSSDTKTYTGLQVTAANGLNQNGAGATIYNGVAVTIPALTQTSGTITGNGLLVTTPSSITTGGTANGLNISTSGIDIGTLNAINVGNITAGAGTETAINIGSGWDNFLKGPNFAINSNGNLGIGTTAPAYNLSVIGTANFTGNVGVGGSLTVSSGLSLPAGSVLNSYLANSSISVSATAGTGLSVSGSPVSLGGTLTVSGIDASTSVKGVASFNATNFSVSSGAVNTIQDIATSATPTFAGLTTTTGNLGIGTSATGSRLAVNGAGIFGWGTAAVTGPTNGLAVFGNVGIGTTSPAYKLDVIGQVNGSTGLCIAGDCKSSWTGVGGYTASNGITLSSQDFQLGGSLTQATGIDINSQNFGFLGGNVGIGTTGPTSKLTILDATNITSGSNFTNRIAPFYISDGTNGLLMDTNQIESTGGMMYLNFSAAQSVNLRNGSLVVNTSTVGVGTASPGSMLGVAGNFAVGATYGLAAAPASGAIIEGNVGIGTTGPTARLEARYTNTTISDLTAFFRGDGTSTGGVPQYVLGVSRQNSTVPALYLGNDASSNAVIAANNTSLRFGKDNTGVFTDYMYINTSGNVGIGTTGPGYKLDVNGTTNITGALSVGSLTNSGTFLAANGSATAPSYAFTNLTNAGLWTNGNGLLLTTGGSNTSGITVTGAGNVGIGMTNPSYTLDVTGTLHVSGSTVLGGPISETGNGPTTFSGSWTGLGASAYNYFKINPQYSDGVGGTLVGLNVDMTSANLTITNKYAATFLGGNVGIGTATPLASLYVTGNTMIGYASGAPASLANGLAVAGNVGIGTTSPGTPLEVYRSTAGAQELLRLWNPSDSPSSASELHFRVGSGTDSKAYLKTNWDTSISKWGLTLGVGSPASDVMTLKNGNVGIGTTSPLAGLYVTNNAMIGYASGAPASLANGLAVAGNVGIGTTSPASALSVIGTIRSSNAFTLTGNGSMAIFGGTGGGVELSSVGGSPLTLSANGSGNAQFQISSAGNIGIGVTAAGSNLQLSGNGVIGFGGATSIAGPTNGLAVFGNVGIGTTSPNFKLDVNGIVNATALYVNGTPYIGSQWTTEGSNIYYSTGNVGIGFTSPTSLFQVNSGSTAFTVSSTGNVGIGSSLTVGSALCLGGTCQSSWSTSGGSETTTASNGLTLSGSDVQLGGTLSADTKININSQNFGFFGGNVGIGTTNPVGALDVTNTSNTAASFSLTNNTATTIGNGANTLGVIDLQSTTLTTGNFFNIELNALSTGKGLNLTSTSTAFSSGFLANLDWSPTTQTSATGSMLNIGIGVSGMGANYLNLTDAGSSIFSISKESFTTSIPTSFTAPGDVAIAYDINMTNPTTANIKSAAPINITAGEIFNSSDLTLSTYNQGSIVLTQNNNPTAAATAYAVQILPTIISSTNSMTYTALYGTYNLATVNLSGNAATDLTTLYSNYTGLNAVAGTIGTWIGQYIAAPTGSGTVTTKYALITDPNTGNVGIGNSGPVQAFQVNNTTNSFVVTSAGNIGIGFTSPVRSLQTTGSIRMGPLITGGGSAVAMYRDANGDLADSTSSILYKTDVTPYSSVLDKVMQLNAVDFKWNDLTPTPGAADFGMIAEQVNTIMPDLVIYNDDGVTPHGLKYDKMGLIALKAIQEQQTQFMALKNSLNISADGTLNAPKLSTDHLILSADVNFATDPLHSLLTTNYDPSTNNYAVDVLASLGSLSENILGISNTEASNSAQITDLSSVIASDSAAISTHQSALDELKANIASLSAQLSAISYQSSDSAQTASSSSSLTADDSVLTTSLNLTPPDLLLATGSATLANINVTSDATVSGKLIAYDLDIQNGLKALGKTTLGDTTVAGNFTVDGTLSIENGSEINVIGTLFLQKSILADSLDILNGQFIFTPDGTLTVSGTVLASQFAVKAGTTAGAGTILAGQIDTIIINTYVDSNSVILITPHTPLNQTMAVADKVAGGFLVKLAHTEGSDIKFDYLIVGVKP